MRYSLPGDRKKIFAQGQRSSISPSLTRNRKKFEQFYQTFLPSFLEKLDSCQCSDSISVCPLARRIMKQGNLVRAQKQYQEIKATHLQEFLPMRNQLIPQDFDKVLKPHLSSLLRLIEIDRIEPLVQILRHSKCEFIAFWVYAILCKKWCSLEQFTKKVKEMAIRKKMDIDFESIEIEQKVYELYITKLAVIGKENYLKVVNLVIEKEDFPFKLAALALIGGRKRQSYEIVKAAIELEP